ncbi:hypothetical protein M404DRAFT_35428 [Pisolithus tinctorius Marx 270]|uniref:Uncharacterized protein n=1 Tax=Pisolithus tinctorius Marx 270 TaxID=870435 RepID=A0A0C3NE41_PISTI|nr:hypothetical protein M404DRAFT_35428 [Pisolithus tinctorius Marx 270]
MAPKREASQTKDASPAKRMQSATSNQHATASVSTNQPEVVSEHQPCHSDLAPSSTPLTDTLPSTHSSVTARASSPNLELGLQSPPRDVQPINEAAPTQQASSSSSYHPNLTTAATTVSTVVPTPASCVIDPESMSNCPEPLMRCLQTLSTYSNVDTNTFALRHLLANASWGMTTAFDDHSKLLCNPKTNEPINIWILGHISSTWFIKNDEPDNQCSMTILPLSSDLGQYANQLILALSTPALHMSYICSFSVNVFDTGLIHTPILFNSIYDARVILRSKSSMQKLDISYLEKRALILVETHLEWYHQKDDNGCWTISRAQFELQAIYLLQEPCVPEAQKSNKTSIEITGLEI